MPIISNAAPSEQDSPFYKRNEKLCNDWSDYILAKNGAINGKFNAWSLHIKSKVETDRTWYIEVKKATYSNGFLLFSSKSQNLTETLTFRTTFLDTDCRDFRIKKSKFKGRSSEHLFACKIKELLKGSLDDKWLHEVLFKNSELTIVFHHKNDWFDMADRILAFDYTFA